jgi:hypothetical protein
MFAGRVAFGNIPESLMLELTWEELTSSSVAEVSGRLTTATILPNT